MFPHSIAPKISGNNFQIFPDLLLFEVYMHICAYKEFPLSCIELNLVLFTSHFCSFHLLQIDTFFFHLTYTHSKQLAAMLCIYSSEFATWFYAHSTNFSLGSKVSFLLQFRFFSCFFPLSSLFHIIPFNFRISIFWAKGELVEGSVVSIYMNGLTPLTVICSEA